MNMTPEVIDRIQELMAEGTNKVIEHEGMIPHMIVNREHHDIVGLEVLQNTPSRKRVCVTVDSAESFVDYVNEHKTDDTRIFARIHGQPLEFTVVAAIDFHNTKHEGASWITHTVTMAPGTSDEWKDWMGQNGKSFSQVEFAEFLEDHQPDISTPDGATLLEIASTLEATRSVNFLSSVRLDNGDRGFKMDEATRATAGVNGELEVPTGVTIYIPVFDGCRRVFIEAKLRHRLDPTSGKLSFSYKLNHPRDVMRDAARTMLATIKDDTGVVAFNGSYKPGNNWQERASHIVK